MSPLPPRPRLIPLILACVTMMLIDASAQVPASPDRFDFEAQIWQVREVDGDRAVAALGAVQIRWKDAWLRCDRLVGWLTQDDEESSEENGGFHFSELYAEGTVVYHHGEEFVECHQAFIDTANNRGVFISGVLGVELSGREGRIPITVRAAELRQLGRRRFEAVDVSMTTCPFGAPHYHLSADSIRAQIEPPGVPPDGAPGETVRNIRFDVDSSVLRVGDLPILPLPSFTYHTASGTSGQFGYIKGIRLNSSSRFGPSVRLDIGDDIEMNGRNWGRWLVRPQYLGDRGPGVGVELDYRVPDDYRGRFEAWYQHDDGKDRFTGKPDTSERGRVLLRHRQYLPEDIQLDFEFAVLSDPTYLREYHEGEFKSGKDQETLVYFKRAVENRALTFLANVRMNSFLSQVEHLPQVGYNLVSEPLFDIGDDVSVYYSADWEAGYLRNELRNRLPGHNSTYRIDLDNTVEIPFSLGPFKIRPFGGIRYTRYGSGRLDGESIDRFGSVHGIRLTTELHRTFDTRGGLFDLFGLRHIILPEIEYRHVSYVSENPTRLIQFDRVDGLDEEQTISFGVRNRLQTIWDLPDGPTVVDIVDLDVEWTYFPDADRDNGGSEVGNLDVDFLFRPARDLTFLTDFEYNFDRGTMEVFNSTVGWVPSQDIQLAASYRRFVGVNDAVFLQANFRISEKWGVIARSGFDFAEDDFQDQRLTLRRIGHDWVLEIRLDYDNSTNDLSFGISITPRALFDPRLRSRTIRAEPRFEDFGERFIK